MSIDRQVETDFVHAEKSPIPDETRAYLDCLAGRSSPQMSFSCFHPINKNYPEVPAFMHGTIDECWARLKRANDLGAGVYVLVNECNGKRRTKENIIRKRAVWIEADEGTPENLPIQETMLVQSSEGKYHYYFCLDGDDLTDEQFAAIMLCMVTMHGSDKNAKDVTRILRVPGFNHTKAGPQPVWLLSCSGPRYSAATLVECFKPAPPLPPAKASPTPTSLPGSPMPSQGNDFDRVAALLNAMPTQNDRSEWAPLMAAVKLVCGEPGRAIMRAYSARSDKFNEASFNQVWNSFKRSEGANIGFVVNLAKKHIGEDAVAAICARYPSGTLQSTTPGMDLPSMIKTRAPRALVDQGEGPQPLVRDASLAEELPDEAMGQFLEIANALQRVVNTSRTSCFMSAFGSANFAVQAYANVVQEHGDGGSVPISLMIVLSAPSGERKSSLEKYTLRGARAHAKRLNASYVAALPAYEIAFDAYKTKYDQTKSLNKALQESEDALKAIPKPVKPLNPQLIFSDVTPEGLAQAMQSGQRANALITDEGGIIVGGHAMKEDTKIFSAAFFSKLNDGSAFERTRAKETYTLSGYRQMFLVGMQPIITKSFLRDPILRGQGLLARVHVVEPTPLRGTRFLQPGQTSDPRDIEIIQKHNDRIEAILARPQPINKAGELEPRRLRMSAEGHELWRLFYNHVEALLPVGGAFDAQDSYGSKLPEQTTRMAATFALYEDIDAIEISAAHVRSAIHLASYLAGERLRLEGEAPAAAQLVEADRVRKWLANYSDEFITARELVRSGPGIRDTQKANAIIKVLVDHNWLAEAPNIKLNGRTAKRAFKIARAS
jgi:hypothetical protein